MLLRRVIGSMCLLVLLVPTSCTTSSTRRSAGSDPDPDPFSPPLFARCERLTLEEAHEKAPFQLAMPSARVASAESLSGVWFCSARTYVLEFRSGVTAWFAWNDIADPPAEWRSLARHYEEFSVGDVNGVPASLADPAVDGAIGGVDWVVDGVRYTVSGNGEIPLEDLIAVARSMPIESPS